MYKNYFLLNRVIIELNDALAGFFITSIFSQEKNKAFFEFSKKEDKRFLEVSVNHGDPSLLYKENFHRAKKNSIDVFDAPLPSLFIEAQIAVDDRVIKIKTEKGDFFFAVRGKYTNLHFISGGKIDSFKKPEDDIEEGFAEEILKLNFISSFNHPNFELNREVDFFLQVKNKYPFVGKEILTEIKFREKEKAFEERTSLLYQILKELKENNPAVFIDEKSGEINLSVESFNIFSYDIKKRFTSILEAYNYFISKRFSLENIFSKRKIIAKFLERELYKTTSRINNLRSRVERGSNEEELKKIGNLLLINLNNISHAQEKIELDDIYENKKLTVKLDPKLPPQKNADLYFDKAKSEKTAYLKSKELYESSLKDFNHLKKIEESFNKAETPDELKEIMKELKIKGEEKSSPQDEMKSKFKQYLIEGKYKAFVGKDSRNNDLLTTKFAKQNDYWFHARSVPGSHLVLKVENTKEPVPKNILKKAASLAAYHSKAKTSGMAPVSYSLKKYVVKKKGMEPGKVALLKEEVLIVKPEIPADCEYVTEE